MSNSVPGHHKDASGLKIDRVGESIADDIGGRVEDLRIMGYVIGNLGGIIGDCCVHIGVEWRYGWVLNGEGCISKEWILRPESKYSIRVNLF